MKADYVHKDSTTLVQDETGIYIKVPKDKIKFNSKEAEIIFDLTLENDELRLKNQELKKQLEEYLIQNINLRADIMIQKMAFPNELIKDKTFYNLYDMPTYEELLVQQKNL